MVVLPTTPRHVTNRITTCVGVLAMVVGTLKGGDKESKCVEKYRRFLVVESVAHPPRHVATRLTTKAATKA